MKIPNALGRTITTLAAALLGLAPLAALPAPAGASPLGHSNPFDSFDPAPTAPTARPIGCYTPVCPPAGTVVSDNGGQVLTHPIVYIVRFSASRTTVQPAGGLVPQLADPARAGTPSGRGLVLATLTGSHSTLFNEYMMPSAPYRGAAFGGVLTWYSPQLATDRTVTDHEFKLYMDGLYAHHQVPTRSGYQPVFVLMTRASQTVSAWGYTSQMGFCAYHSQVQPHGATPLAYVVLPYEPLGSGCDSAAGPKTLINQESPVLSHELDETVTDPYTKMAWVQPQSYAEVADLCEATSAAADSYPVTYDGVAYQISPMFSNVAHACVGTPEPTTIYSTLDASGALSVKVVSPVGAVQDQPVTVSDGTSTLTATTDATGSATLALPASTGVVTVAFAGAGPLEASTETVAPTLPSTTLAAAAGAPSVSTTAVGPATVSAQLVNGVNPIASATLDLVAAGQTVVGTAVTNDSGTATFTVPTIVPQGTALSVVYAGSAASAADVTDASVPNPVAINIDAPSSVTLPNQPTATITLAPALADVHIAITQGGIPVISGVTDATGTFTAVLPITAAGMTTFVVTISLGTWSETSTVSISAS